MQQANHDDEDNLVVVFSVPLDDATVTRLMDLANACHAPPALVMASIIRDVLNDDAIAHAFDATTETLQ